MNKQEQINALRFRIEQIEAKFAEQNKPNRSEKPNSSEPGDWSKAPDWANWKAMDKCGRWYWYEGMPRMGDSIWRYPGLAQIIIGQTETDKDWTQTLEKRPHQLFHIAIHEAISTEPDPYEVDWSKAPEWADSHFYNGNVGHWGGLKYNIHGYYLWLEPSGFTLSKELDWKQSKRRRPQ